MSLAFCLPYTVEYLQVRIAKKNASVTRLSIVLMFFVARRTVNLGRQDRLDMSLADDKSSAFGFFGKMMEFGSALFCSA